MISKRFIQTQPLALVLAVTAATAAQAQSDSLEEVIVTAERRTATLQETDISMTVIGANTLDEISFTTYEDIAFLTPNMMVQEQPARSGYAVSIRGFKNGETVATFEPKVAVYLDGVLLSKNAGSAFDVLDLERIEVLRGPQGTLYGRNTAGGAINMISKKPSDELEGRVKLTLGNYDQQEIRGTLNLPLVGPNGLLSSGSDSKLALKFNLASLERDGYWDNRWEESRSGELGSKDREVAHVQLQWQPSDSLTFLYSFDKTDIDEDPMPYVLTAIDPAIRPELIPYVERDNPSSIIHNADNFVDTEVEGHSLTIDWAIGDTHTLTSISAYRDNVFVSFQDADASPFTILHNDASHDFETFSQELRLAGTIMDSRLDYVVGGFYMKEDINDFYSTSILSGGFVVSALGGSAENEIWAVFGEGTYSLTEKLDFTLGARYTEEDREMSKYDQLIIGGAGDPVVFPTGSDTWDDISGTVSLTYQWTDDLMTYFKVSKGYVSGGYNSRAPGISAFLAGYDEETVYTYELGWKTTWLDNKVLVNGAVFYNDYEELQVNRFDPETTRNNIANAGDATIAGLELEVAARITENLEVGGGYGYLDLEYKTFIDPFTGDDLSDNFQWPHAPENSFNVYGRYVVPIGSGDLAFRLDYVWVDDYPMLPALGTGLNDENGYDQINARATWNMDGPGETRIAVALWGKNLTDETIRTSGVDVVTNPSLGFAQNTLAAPRTYGIDLSLEF